MSTKNPPMKRIIFCGTFFDEHKVKWCLSRKNYTKRNRLSNVFYPNPYGNRTRKYADNSRP